MWQFIDKVSGRQSWFNFDTNTAEQEGRREFVYWEFDCISATIFQMDLSSTIEREKKVIIVSLGMFCFLLTSISINVPIPSRQKILSNSRRAGCRRRLCAYK